MKRFSSVLSRVLVVGGLLFIIAVVILILLGPGFGFLSFIAPVPPSPPDIQPTITYLASHPDDLPEGLHLRAPPGTVKASDLCIYVIYLPCEGDQNRANLPSDQNHCGLDATISVDGSQVTPSSMSLLDLTQIDGHWYSDAEHCLRQLVAPGPHLFTVDAYPMGRSAHYSWVWTVEP